MKMKIKGELGEYMVEWKEVDFLVAKKHVYKLSEEVKFLLWKWRSDILVWVDDSETLELSKCRKIYPKAMMNSYKSAVENYENYVKAWRDYYKSLNDENKTK